MLIESPSIMKRIKLNKTQIKQVMELRQSGYSFSAIEKETGIPRRVAQRAYQEWEEKSSWEDLKRVRSDVIDRDFSQHVDLVTNLAQRLVAGMDVWISEKIPLPAEEYLVDIWKDEIESSLNAYLHTNYYNRRERIRRERQHQMLFGTLKQHTGKEVPWAVLEEWKASWDRYRTVLPHLQEQISKVVRQRVKKESSVWKGITPYQSEPTTLDTINKGLLKVLLLLMVSDKSPDEVFDWEVESPDESAESVILKQKPFWMLRVPTSDQVDMVKASYASVVDQLWDSQPMQSLCKESKTIQEAADTLDEALDPLRLRPMILNSRCDLCPV